MKVLIIYAHPAVDGNCSSLLDEVVGNLRAKEIDYELMDLYKIKYDPVIHENELYTSGGRDVSEQDKEFQQKILTADLMIFIYPVWWNTMPAMMKGFIDKVFTPHYAFAFKGLLTPGWKQFFSKIIPGRWGFMIDFGKPQKLLKGKRALVFCTTSSPKIATFFILGNRFKKIIKKDMLGFFGIKAKVYHIDNAKKMNEYQSARIKRVVKRAMKRI